MSNSSIKLFESDRDNWKGEAESLITKSQEAQARGADEKMEAYRMQTALADSASALRRLEYENQELLSKSAAVQEKHERAALEADAQQDKFNESIMALREKSRDLKRYKDRCELLEEQLEKVTADVQLGEKEEVAAAKRSARREAQRELQATQEVQRALQDEEALEAKRVADLTVTVTDLQNKCAYLGQLSSLTETYESEAKMHKQHWHAWKAEINMMRDQQALYEAEYDMQRRDVLRKNSMLVETEAEVRFVLLDGGG